MPPPGFKRSRALWDEARRKGAPVTAWVRAILYELQPFRFSTINVGEVRAAGWSLLESIYHFLARTVPSILRNIPTFGRSLSKRHWNLIGGVLIYCYIVRYVHRILDAGPLVLIISALVAIFTIGLGDNERTGGLSAYSVFNRGFQQLMGSVDVDSLVQQHVGGAALGGAAAMPPPAENANPPRPQQPLNMQQQAIRQEADAPAEAFDPNDDDGMANNDGHESDTNEATDRARPERSRRSRKKSRRNMEERREMQTQRQLAREMGFDGGDQAEALAMQRLIEEQIAANNARDRE